MVIRGSPNDQSGIPEWSFGDLQMTIRGSPNDNSGISKCPFGDPRMFIWGSANDHLGILSWAARNAPFRTPGGLQLACGRRVARRGCETERSWSFRIENPRHPKSLEALRVSILSGQERSILHPRRAPRSQWPPEVENVEICKMLDKPVCFHTSPAHAQKHS